MMRYFVLAAAVGVVGHAEAGSITYIEAGSGSGYLGTSNFTDALVTLTATADTGNITTYILGFAVPAASATVNVAGIGTATITAPVIVFVMDMQQGFPLVPHAGFAFEPGTPNEGFSTIMTLQNSAFASYNLATSIGPLTGPGGPTGPGSPFGTSLGSFAFTDFLGTSTFQATAVTVPEPSTLVEAGTSILVLASYAWRRRRRPRW